MKSLRTYGYCALICLPALLLIGGWACSLVFWVPSQVRAQQSRIGKTYRQMATEFVARPETAQRVGGRPKGLRKTSAIGGWDWGHYNEAGRSYVWIQSAAKEWRVKEVETPDAFPYALVFHWGGGAVALVLLLLSATAVWSFVHFMKAREDFMNAALHDLTTPLVGLRRCIGTDAAEAKNLNERMLRLVSNLKDFLRPGGNRPQPRRETFDLLAAYREAYALFAADYRDLFDDEDVAVDCSRLQSAADAGTPTAMVCADETMTVQILWNLLGNDLKYAAPYGKVSVRLSRDGRMVRAEFVDEGQGMTARQRRKAFNRYYRAKTVLESGKGGFGIGLCTAKEFARAMGGDLTVAANRPKGCVFTLALPSAVSDQS